MMQVFNYLIISSVYLVVFYLFYLLFLSGDTHYRRNRIYLISSLVLSLILPLVKIHITGDSVLASMNRNIAGLILIDQVDVFPGSGSSILFPLLNVTSMIYFVGLILSIAFLVKNTGQIVSMISRGRKKGSRIIYTDSDNISGFSAFGFIFLNRELAGRTADCIIDHEYSHIKQAHYIDLILMKIVSVILWFNPLVYLFERSLKAVHEYQADEQMIIIGHNPVTYRQLILNQLFRTKIFTLNNAFSGKTLIKKRMIMMTKERSGKLAGLKLLFALPLILLIFIGFSCTSEKNEILEPVKEIKEVADAGTLNTAEPVGELKSIAEDKEIFTVVEVMPTFMGGDINKFREWVSRNVKYPAEAAKEGIQGQVFVMFVVDENGKVSGSEILRGVDPSLDAEALRVVNMSPDWTPGTQRGKDVKVKFSITVNYKLQ